MTRPPDKIPENIDFAAQELLEAPEADRPAMLENIAKALTMRLLKGEPERVTEFVKAVRERIQTPQSHPGKHFTVAYVMVPRF